MLKFIFPTIIIALVAVLLRRYIDRKRTEFNKVKIGDKIYYMVENLYQCHSMQEYDIVTAIEYDDKNNIRLIYTEDEMVYNFLDYIRDNFALSTNEC